MRVSFPRVREIGKVPPFCFQARFPRHGGAEESKIKLKNVPENDRVTGVARAKKRFVIPGLPAARSLPMATLILPCPEAARS